MQACRIQISFLSLHACRALQILAEVFPERRVVGVATREILLGGGNIHVRSASWCNAYCSCAGFVWCRTVCGVTCPILQQQSVLVSVV